MADSQILTYTTLVSDVIAFMERTDTAFIDEVPRFILYAEKEIAAEFKTLWELKVENTMLTLNQIYFTLPARTRKVVSLSVNGAPLYERSADLVKLYNSADGLNSGIPQYWSYYDYNNLLVAPVPDASYPIELIYHEQVQPLSEDNQQNLLSREAPQLLLYATMYQASLWAKNPTQMQYWQGFYTQASNALKQEDVSRVIDRNTSVIQAGSPAG